MSWSLQVNLVHEHTGIGLQKVLDELNAAIPSGNEQCVKERDDQVRAATDAVFRMIVDGGALDNAEEISVSMAGHANEGHKKDASWADEYIQISLYVKKYRTD